MKGLKFWAMLGGVAVLANCWTSAAIADDAKSEQKPAPFNELQAGGSKRGIRLDELFESLRRYKAQQNGQAATSTPSTGVTTAATVKHAPKQAVAVRVPVKATPTQPKVATKTPTVAKNPKAKPAIQTAIYNHPTTHVNETVLATVSSGGGSLKTPIISASLDKPGALPKYKSGDRMVVKLTAQSDCNVLVFDYDSKGTLTQLYPNEYEPNGVLRAGQSVEIGGTDSKYTLDVAGKGIERIFVYAYPTSEQPITVAMTPVPSTPFRSVELSPDQYKRLVKESAVYFEPTRSSDRSVKVTPKGSVQPASTASNEKSDKQPNKLELTFQIDN